MTALRIEIDRIFEQYLVTVHVDDQPTRIGDLSELLPRAVDTQTEAASLVSRAAYQWAAGLKISIAGEISGNDER